MPEPNQQNSKATVGEERRMAREFIGAGIDKRVRIVRELGFEQKPNEGPKDFANRAFVALRDGGELDRLAGALGVQPPVPESKATVGVEQDWIDGAKSSLDHIGGFRGNGPEEHGVVACAQALISIAEDVRAMRTTLDALEKGM